MNKYKKALNAIGDTLTYYMVRKDLASLPSENEIYDAMAVLRQLVYNTDTPEETPVSEKLPKKKSMNQLWSQKRLLIAIRS